MELALQGLACGFALVAGIGASQMSGGAGPSGSINVSTRHAVRGVQKYHLKAASHGGLRSGSQVFNPAVALGIGAVSKDVPTA